MQTVTVHEFHNHVAKWLRAEEPFVVTRHGKEPLGVYYPAGSPEATKEMRWSIFEAMTQEIGQQLKRKGLSEKEIMGDFEEWKKSARKNRR